MVEAGKLVVYRCFEWPGSLSGVERVKAEEPSLPYAFPPGCS